MIDLEAMREAAEKATPGPWGSNDESTLVVGPMVYTSMWFPVTIAGEAKADDIEFIAAANPAVVLELVAELEAARECLSRIERMRVTPDDKINRATLIAAIHLARREVNGSQPPG